VEDVLRDEVVAPRRGRWEAVTTVPLVVLGIAYIVAYSLIVLYPSLPSWLGTLVWGVLILTWIVFAVDVVVRILLTPRGRRWSFVRHNMVDVLSAIIPAFRAFRVLRLLREVPYLQRRSGAAVRTRTGVRESFAAGPTTGASDPFSSTTVCSMSRSSTWGSQAASA